MVLLLAIACCPLRARADEPAFGLEEFKAGFDLDAGHIVSGRLGENKLEFMHLNRNIVALEQKAHYGDRLTFEAGLMGVLWWPLSIAAIAPPEQRTLRVDPRVSSARMRFDFAGDDSAAFLEAGFFPYKYNPDAQNLGEYLYRSGTYPGVVVTTNGYQLIDHAAYDAFGLHLRYEMAGGLIRHDVNLFIEEFVLPINDMTPGYELSLNTSIFQAGIGAAYNRGISFQPSATRPASPENSYVEVDSSGASGAFRGPYLLAPVKIKNAVRTGDTSTIKYRITHRWTQRGTKLMARAALDLGFLLPDALRSPGDLRLFAEAAMLGVENQPFYYENRGQRIPVMFGMNVPTFGALDLLSIQGEYYAARFDDIKRQSELSLPIWLVPEWDVSGDPVESAYDPKHYARDDWKWSLYARKTINRLVKVHAQIANDHMRLLTFNSAFTENTLTAGPEDWYYLVRLECGI